MKFALLVEMALETVLGSRYIVREFLEILDVIESIRFDYLPSIWSKRSPRADDHHPGLASGGVNVVYSVTWER